MRVVLVMEGVVGDAVAIALLQEGHAVHRLTPPAGRLALLAGWRGRREAMEFGGEILVGNDAAAERAAAQLGLRHAVVGADVWFLLERGIPVPFCVELGRAPVLGVLGDAGQIGAPHLALTGASWQATLIDVAVLAAEPADEPAARVLADWMAAGRAIAAPSAILAATGLEGDEVLAFDGADPADRARAIVALMGDPTRRQRLCIAARRGFERRHAAARAAFRAALA